MNTKVAFTGLLALTLAQTAQAQSQPVHWAETRSEAQAQVAFTLPLGHARSTARTAPRVELMLRQSTPSSEFAIIDRAEQQRWHERRIGLTLNESPRLMLNGRELQTMERKQGVSDVVLIAGGVVLTLGIGTLIVYDAIDDASE